MLGKVQLKARAFQSQGAGSCFVVVGNCLSNFQMVQKLTVRIWGLVYCIFCCDYDEDVAGQSGTATSLIPLHLAQEESQCLLVKASLVTLRESKEHTQ